MAALLNLIKELELDKMLCSKKTDVRSIIIIMIIARIINAGFKLETHRWVQDTSLPELLGLSENDLHVNRFYEAMDHLLNMMGKIQKHLINQHPIYHRLVDRVRAHAFICILSYYVLWEFERRLQPLFAQNGSGAVYGWTVTEVLRKLSGIRLEHRSFHGNEFT